MPKRGLVLLNVGGAETTRIGAVVYLELEEEGEPAEEAGDEPQPDTQAPDVVRVLAGSAQSGVQSQVGPVDGLGGCRIPRFKQGLSQALSGRVVPERRLCVRQRVL